MNGPRRSAAVVVVNYASHDLLPTALDPLRREDPPAGGGVEVVVVDNPRDATATAAVRDLAADRGWHLVALPRNDGFGSGVNAGLRRARELGCDVAVLLNPDMRITAAVVDALVAAVRADPDLVVAPRLVDASGVGWAEGSDVLLDSGRIRGHRPGRARPADGVPWLSGACVALAVDGVLDRVGGLDPDLFLYWEDVAFSLRWQRVGGRVAVRSDLVAVHDEGGTQRSATTSGRHPRYYFWNARNRLRVAGRELDRRTRVRWIRATPAVTWEIARRAGGRRVLARHPEVVVAAVAGSLAGLAAVVAGLARPAPRSVPAPRVLVVHPGAELYGSDRVTLAAVTGVAAAGLAVDVLTPGDGPLVPALRAAGARCATTPLGVVRRSVLTPRGALGWLGELARCGPLWRAVRAADVVYVATLTVPFAVVLARLARRPVVVHVHEAESRIGAASRLLLYRPTGWADRVVVNSAVTRAVTTAAAPRTADRVAVVLNPVPAVRTSGPRPEPTPPVRLVVTGRISPRKGQEVVVDALARLRERGRPATLDLVGAVFPGYEWCERDLRARVSAAGLDDAVTWHGFVADPSPLVAAADVVVVPSTGDESFGNVVVEGVLAGRPVVVSAVPGLVEATGGAASTRVVAVGDPDALADAVDDLVEHWAQLPPALAEARDAALERHDPVRFGARLVAVLREATAAHR